MRTFVSSLLLALVAGSFFAFSVAAQEPPEPVVLDMRIDSADRVTVGDHVTYTITLEADERLEVSLVRSSLPASVELIGTPQTSAEPLGEGLVELTMTFTLAPFVTGDVALPPLAVGYGSDEFAGGQVETPASRFRVDSVLPEGEPLQPRDLKPQAQIGTAGPAWIVPALAGAAGALVLVLALLYWRVRATRRRARQLPLPEVAIADGPEDRARAVLDEAGANFGADRDYVSYYRAIGVTVRSYLTERYGFPAFALTTRELEQEMLRRGLDRWQVRVASGLLEQCDAVVYASYRPAAERADADLTAAYEIVEMSRPEPEEAEVAVP